MGIWILDELCKKRKVISLLSRNLPEESSGRFLLSKINIFVIFGWLNFIKSYYIISNIIFFAKEVFSKTVNGFIIIFIP